MARVDEEPEDRDKMPLMLSSILTCPKCETDLDHDFQAADGVFEREDLIDPPEDDVVCSHCGHEFHAVWGGWVAHEDAG